MEVSSSRSTTTAGAVAIDAGCEVIVTTDRAFDGLKGLRRVDPLDIDAVKALAGG